MEFSSAMAVAAGLLLVGCGMQETAPPPGDLAGLHRPSSPNTALAGPEGFLPVPDITTRNYDVPPDRLFELVREIVAGLPRSTELAVDLPRRRVDHVVRSLVFRFADVVQVQALPSGAGGSRLVVYSFSRVGRSDFGVNRRRVLAILAALDARLSGGA